MNRSFKNYSKWMLRVNEANKRVNKIKWSSSLCDWKMNQIDNEKKKKKNTGMQLWIMKTEWAMMKDEWQMMKDEWQMMKDEWQMMNDEWQKTNDEWKTFSLLLILSISLSHLLTNLLCHSLYSYSHYHSITQVSYIESLNQSINNSVTHTTN